MSQPEEEIKREIKEYLASVGGAHSDWYVGISKEPRIRLSMNHRVNLETDDWIYRTAITSEEAKEIERYFIMVIGTDGSRGKSDIGADSVFAYKKNERTKP